MKTIKTIIVIVLISNSLSAFSQLKMNSSGKIGIAISPSQAQFHVRGDGIYPAYMFDGQSKDLGYNGYLQIGYYDGTTWYERIKISPYGNVGIGKAPTSYKLDVNGHIHCTNWSSDSDIKFKKEIKSITKDQIDKLTSLNGINYKFDFEKMQKIKKGELFNLNDSAYINDNQEYEERELFGFIAQEVKEIYPEVVYEDDDGNLSISYISFIPILVEALKEQQASIKDQQSQIDQLKLKPKKEDEEFNLKSTKETELTNNNMLFQNNPNPFNETTTISYYINDNVAKARLFIYDLQGKQIKSIDIIDRGNGQTLINGFELQAGMYLYSLITDNVIIDTKQMVLTN